MDEVRIPPTPPAEILELVGFWERMDARLREMRENTALPRTAVTLPDEFDDVVAGLYETIRRQAREALARGEGMVEVRLPVTDRFRALTAWSAERIELLEGLVRAGMVQQRWERPLKLTIEFWQATMAQLE